MMPDLKTWLARKPAGPKPRKRIRPASKKRRLKLHAYAIQRTAYLGRNRWCAVSPVVFGRKARATEVHHMAGRIGKNFLDETTWLPVCRAAHEFIHHNPKEARALGLLK